MSKKIHVYLAGPDVFHPQAQRLAKSKRFICEKYGLTAFDPLDTGPLPTHKPRSEQGEFIFRGNINLMRSADAVIANLKPFRGPGADDGTAFELGFMHAYSKPLVGYMNLESDDASAYHKRAKDWKNARFFERHEPPFMEVEDFHFCHNLMIGVPLLHMAVRHRNELCQVDDTWEDLSAFEECCVFLAGYFKGK